jgi:hypothetical protein
MTRSLLPFRALPIAAALVAGALCWPAVAAAQSADAPAPVVAQPAPVGDGDTIRLTDEQRADLIEHNTSENAARARGELPDSGIADHGIHGEVGFMIGTHGERAAYGEAEIPLGDHAQASVAIESDHYDYGYGRHR